MEYDRLYVELSNNMRVLRAILAGVTQHEATRRPEAESWSMLEVVAHLLDEEREDFRVRLDIILHQPDKPWPPIDPVGWVLERAYNDRDLATTLDELAAERNRSLLWLSELKDPDWRASYDAFFGPIQAGDMFAAWVAHDGLHLRQLVELKRALVVDAAEPFTTRYAGDW